MPQLWTQPSWQRRMRRSLAVVLTATFLWLLTQIPYDIIRQERIRAFGEEPTQALVVSKSASLGLEGELHQIIYRYVGPEGLNRQREAIFDAHFWQSVRPGNSITIYYALGEPNLSRAHLEIEDPFRVWLRNAVRGNDLPEVAQPSHK